MESSIDYRALRLLSDRHASAAEAEEVLCICVILLRRYNAHALLSRTNTYLYTFSSAGCVTVGCEPVLLVLLSDTKGMNPLYPLFAQSASRSRYFCMPPK